MLKTVELFDLGHVAPPLRELLEVTYPWEVLAQLDRFTAGVRRDLRGEVHPTAVLEGEVYLTEGASIGPHAYVRGPVWIGAGAEVGHGAYVRDNAVLGPNTKVGHASEVKRSLLLAGAKAPHFNYVGDAVLGHNVNLGAGVKLANLKAVGRAVTVSGIDTGLRKFSAAMGDDVSVGCNAVLTPGTLIGPRTVVYNGAMLRGVYPADSIVKVRQSVEQTSRH